MELARAVEAVSAYTADQWGLVTSAQAKVVGVNAMTLKRLVAAGLLERVRHGCYLVTSAPARSHLRERAAWLMLDPPTPAWQRPRLASTSGVLSHSSAAALHDVGDLRADVVEIIVPKRRETRDPDLRLRQAALAEADVVLVDGLPVTTVERTILDLLADRHDGGHVGQVIYDAIVRGLVDTDRLVDRMGKHAPRYGVARRDGRALLDDLLVQAGRTAAELSAPRLVDRRHSDAAERAVARLMQSEELRAAMAKVEHAAGAYVASSGLVGLERALAEHVARMLDDSQLQARVEETIGERMRAALASAIAGAMQNVARRPSTATTSAGTAVDGARDPAGTAPQADGDTVDEEDDNPAS